MPGAAAAQTRRPNLSKRRLVEGRGGTREEEALEKIAAEFGQDVALGHSLHDPDHNDVPPHAIPGKRTWS
jgi:hypothetical protein